MKDFYPIFAKLARFFILYFGLMLLYDAYLSRYQNSPKGLDPFSYFQAECGQYALQALGFSCQLVPDAKHHSVWFWLENQWSSRMIEGCNAVSIAILFVAFCYVFYLSFKKNLYFVAAGLGLLFLVNILRIIALNLLKISGSGQFKNFHDYVFPSVMYGSIIILWLVWIKFFVLKNTSLVKN